MDRCEVCGEPGTCMVRDVLTETFAFSSRMHHSPYGEIHHYCDAHCRDSEVTQVSHMRGKEQMNG